MGIIGNSRTWVMLLVAATLLASCTYNSRRVVENTLLVKDEALIQYQLITQWSKHSAGFKDDTITAIQKIGWQNPFVVVYGKANGHKGWYFILDDAVIKTYGPYSNQEFAQRRKELGIGEEFPVYSPDVARQKIN